LTSNDIILRGLRRMFYELMGCYFGKCMVCKKMILNDDDWMGNSNEKTCIDCYYSVNMNKEMVRS
jgi:hypothetical protein